MNAEDPTGPMWAADPNHPSHPLYGLAQAGPSGYPSDGGPAEPMGEPEQPPASWPARWSLRRKATVIGAAVIVAVGAGGAGAAAAIALGGPNTVFASPTSVSPVSSGSGNSTTAQVAAAVQPSVVSITATSSNEQSTGSGVILRSDGVIMTNAHVVNGATQVSVKFSNGKSAPAQVLGSNTAKDIAVIKASGVSGLKPATLGDSTQLAVGDSVLAVGSPLGLDGSVTSGIVSALGRTVSEGDSDQSPNGQGPNGQGANPFGQGGSPFGQGGNPFGQGGSPFDQGGGQGGDQGGGQPAPQQTASIANAIQTDAAINPGNSGGALVNSAGQVIGINSAIATTGSGSGNIGVGFAIPVNDAKKVADDIIAKGGSTGGTTGGTSGSTSGGAPDGTA